MRLDEQVTQISSRTEFADFIRALLLDLKTHQDGWENRDLSSYLEALAAWTDDANGYYRHLDEVMPSSPDWSMLARMFLAARVYE